MEVDAHRLDNVSGARLIGGEMLTWSDLDRRPEPGVAGVLAEHLAGPKGFGRVLLVGARAAQLAATLPQTEALDVLVRGLPDARTLAVEAQLRPGVTVHCGTIANFVPRGEFDLVILLDPPEAVVSPDGDALGQVGLLALAASWLAPAGRLVVLLANELGFDRMFALDVSSRRADDAAWGWEAPGLAARPLYARELPAVLAEVGLVQEATYAVLPSVDNPSLAVTEECAADPVVGGRVASLAAQALAAHFSTRPALSDPYELAHQMFDSGECLALAPGWLLVLRPGAGGHAGGEDAALPQLLATEPGVPIGWSAVHTVTGARGAGTWTTRPRVPGEERRERAVVRRFDRSGDGPARPGASLELLLRQACLHHDVATVRALVQRYDRWLRSGTGASTDDPRLFAVPSNVLVHDDELSIVDATWAMAIPLPDQVLLTHGLRDFALRLLAVGAEHPWAADISPDALTRTLAAMASLVVDHATFDAVARVAAEVEVVLHGGGDVAESLAYAAQLGRGRSQFVAQSGPARGYRQVNAANVRLAQELEERSRKVEWLEATLTTRDTRVKSLESQLRGVRGSLSFRIGQIATFPGRMVVTLGRRIVNGVLPMDLIRKAEAFARSFLEGARR